MKMREKLDKKGTSNNFLPQHDKKEILERIIKIADWLTELHSDNKKSQRFLRSLSEII